MVSAEEDMSVSLIVVWLATGPVRMSEFEPRLKRDHARRTIASQAHAQQSRRRRRRIAERTESGLRRGLPRNARVPQNGQAEVRVIEHVEELPIDAQSHPLLQRKPF